MTSANNSNPRKRTKKKQSTENMAQGRTGRGTSSSLNSIQMQPRTPRSPEYNNQDMDEVELSLLGEEDRQRAAVGLSDEFPSDVDPKRPFSARDKRAMSLLIVLCASLSFSHLQY
jgi:PAT family acetyl-CoA transporter-like MFS transporter 1